MSYLKSICYVAGRLELNTLELFEDAIAKTSNPPNLGIKLVNTDFVYLVSFNFKDVPLFSTITVLVV